MPTGTRSAIYKNNWKRTLQHVASFPRRFSQNAEGLFFKIYNIVIWLAADISLITAF
jgi:hypothetical protein